ncbi:hypothetical protein IC620_16255 [Hazenella sp. IB182357]|uniref:Sporulation membrane protein YtrI C-terminal domain-containing protein n=1 Tax=Polycladospora coralii TaxID=2771432 RepID=A0A926NC52_9BACL|nr:hypothetical protein [Polycladospora coralii]MBD1373898.1 hypothetical protein [Polycladospora coralii]MBS7529546.1 hypothetical protein [Polycladospora coralii]
MARELRKSMKSNLRAIILFFIGLLIGAGIVVLFYIQRLDSLLAEREELYHANNQKYEEILGLQQELAKYSQGGEYRVKEEKIRKIVVEVNSDQKMETAIKQKIEDMLTPFYDKNVTWISNNPDLIELVLQNQQITIDNDPSTKFRIHLKYLSFFRSTLKIWVNAKSISDDGVSD